MRLSFYLRNVGTVLLMMLILSVTGVGCNRHADEAASGQTHPLLILKKEHVDAIKKGITRYPLMNESFLASRNIADMAIERGITVPVPKDPGGGYTHELHKNNYVVMYHAGLVYQLSGEERYAVFVRDMLLKYADLYPTLGLHPESRGSGPGKIFWQGLNESVWLVYTIQAYDCIYDFITADERKKIEDQLFHRMVRFFTEEDSYSFDRIHNHGTWTVAGVGLTGLVLGEEKYVEMALYGTHLDSTSGFMRQIFDLFSPDGFYSEGPYYQRYAIMPFIIFAKALDNNRPEKAIFAYKDSVLLKAVTTLVQLTDNDGRFYPLNDAMKEKSLESPELVFATNIACNLTGNNELLDVARQAGNVMLSLDGLAVAGMIQAGHDEPFTRRSLFLCDGSEGTKGGLAIMRSGHGASQSSVIFKFTTQGMGHGHFDRLSFVFYDRGNEIFSDYGAARFVNVESKDGGRYLPENKSWAVQTIAHNTVTVNGESQFGASVKRSEEHYSTLLFHDLDSSGFQIVAAADSNSYEGVLLQRTLGLLNAYDRLFIIDLYRIQNARSAVYDLPFHYNGQITSVNFNYKKELVSKKAFGIKNGYQHLWVDGLAESADTTASVTFMNDRRFYTLSVLGNRQADIYFTSLGAGDPNDNLRYQPGIIFRQNDTKSHAFLSVTEAHGSYLPFDESVHNSAGSVKTLELKSSGDDCSLIIITMASGKKIRLGVSHFSDPGKEHSVSYGGEEFRWKGNYKLTTE